MTSRGHVAVMAASPPARCMHAPHANISCRYKLSDIDGPARRAGSRASHCTQNWTLGVISWRRSSVERRPSYFQLILTDNGRRFITANVQLCRTKLTTRRRSTCRGSLYTGRSCRESAAIFGCTRISFLTQCWLRRKEALTLKSSSVRQAVWIKLQRVSQTDTGRQLISH